MKKLSGTTWPALAKGMYVTSIYSLCNCNNLFFFFCHALPCLSRSSMWNWFEVLSLLLLSPQKKSEIVLCLPKSWENTSCVYTELSVYVSFESQNKDMLYYNNNIEKSMCVHFLNIHFGSEVSWLAQKERKSFHATSFTRVL